MTLPELLKQSVDLQASDLHIVSGVPPMVRIHGELKPIPTMPVMDGNLTQTLVWGVLRPEQKDLLIRTRELDFSLTLAGIGRFRANAYFQKGTVAIDLRVVKEVIPTIEELKLPSICHTFASLRQGFVLVTGPTGHGKTSTLAAVINEINQKRAEHVVTIEDPIEFVYQNIKSIFSQREMGSDTLSWDGALRSVLREDPDVVMVGEMRDAETMQAALTVAETGHLVFSTLHTNSASQTVDRVVDSFPEHKQGQIRLQLATVLEAVLSIRLVPSRDGGRVPACEIMVATPAIRTLIREAKTHQIDSVIQTSAEVGMVTLEGSLASLVNQGVVDLERAREHSLRPAELMRLVKRI